MNVGDKVRIGFGPACLTLLGMPQDQVGVIRRIDENRDHPAVLISFPDADVYVSALHDADVEVVGPKAGPVAAREAQAPDLAPLSEPGAEPDVAARTHHGPHGTA